MRIDILGTGYNGSSINPTKVLDIRVQKTVVCNTQMIIFIFKDQEHANHNYKR